MEPCTMPTLGSAPAQSQCGCARTGQPVATEARDLAFLGEPREAAPERLSLAVPLVAVAFAAFVFARQRRPSAIVRLHLSGPPVIATRRGGFRVPRLVPSEAERRVLGRIAAVARRVRTGRPVSRPEAVTVAVVVAVAR